MHKEGQKQRRLGYLETFNALLHDHVDGHGTMGVAVEVAGVIEQAFFRKALTVLFARHPLLRAVLASDKSEEYTLSVSAKFDDIPIVIQECGGAESWQTAYQMVVDEPLLVDRYLWRACLQLDRQEKKSYLVFGFHHAISDGLSAVTFAKELLDYVASLVNGTVPQPTPLSLLPPLEERLDKQKVKAARLTVAEGQPDSQLVEIEGSKVKWPFLEADPGVKGRRTGHVFRVMESDDLEAVKAACKSEGVTVNDVLNAALLQAAHAKSHRHEFETDIWTPIDLRKYCSPEVKPDVFGFNVAMIPTRHYLKRENGAFWKVAREYHEALRKNILQVTDLPQTFSAGDIKRRYIDACLEDRNTFSMDFGISNLGYVQTPNIKENEFSLNSFYFSVSRKAADFVLLICVATVNGRMYLDFSFTQPLLPEKWVEDFADLYLEILYENINSAM